MFCKNCGHPLGENAAGCENCNTPFGQGNAFCPLCGNAVSDLDAVCPQCGVELQPRPSGRTQHVNLTPTQRITALPKAIATCYAKSFTFSGRATRGEYWWWRLYVTILMLPLLIGYSILTTAYTFGSYYYYGYGSPAYSAATIDTARVLIFVGFILWIIHFLPTLAVTVRRLHDTGHSGLFYLVNFIPIVGPIIVLFSLFQGSDPDNEYGAAPKRG